MGAGKSTVGRRLAARLNMPFVDADHEIEAAAGCTIPEFFERHGEAEFRDGESRVIARLLHGEPKILATGGGAFMNPETRKLIRVTIDEDEPGETGDLVERLMGKKPELRFQYIQENARFVEELDV